MVQRSEYKQTSSKQWAAEQQKSAQSLHYSAPFFTWSAPGVFKQVSSFSKSFLPATEEVSMSNPSSLSPTSMFVRKKKA